MFAADADGLPEPEILVTLLRLTSLPLLDSASFAAAFDSAFLCALRSARALSPASFRCCLIIAFAPVGSSSSSSSLSDSDSDELSPEDPESSCGFCSARSANAPTRSVWLSAYQMYRLFPVEVAKVHSARRARRLSKLIFRVILVLMCAFTGIQSTVAGRNDPQR